MVLPKTKLGIVFVRLRRNGYRVGSDWNDCEAVEMDIHATNHQFASWIAESLRASLTNDPGGYDFTLGDNGNTIQLRLRSDVAELDRLIDELRGFDVAEELRICHGKCYEVLLREESPIPRFRLRLRGNALSTFDAENDIRSLVSGLKSLQINGFRLSFKFPTCQFGCSARQI